ncbi:hypothetical protein Apa02nite_081950 [Actinoplanes palleronii]|uniref:DUF4352 domain-containing protein n=1 Tax=Actinoplanes palleronii TaxID=113570 RepID=A0ABQ4BNA3_9ACTN|nr:hypothetical protein Apa02nite_081950 [Actinoplanes palleronii]
MSPLKVSLAVVASLVVVVALFAAGIAAEQYSHTRSAAVTATTSPPAKVVPAGPGFGDAVRDGKFQFVVSAMDCSRTSIGVERLKRTAAGKFCVISLSVRDIGDGTKYFIGYPQKARDASGGEYRIDELASLYANHGTDAFLKKLAPGKKATSSLVFDVPRGVTLATLELHDSPFSGGVEVTLR